MIIDDVHRGIKKRKERKRIGRGRGSGHGKTSGRGQNGYFSRSGASKRAGFEGGQTPLARRIAKRGFNNKVFAPVVAIVNLSTLEKHFQNGETVNRETLQEKGILKGRFDEIKILAKGSLSRKKLHVAAHRFSYAAEKQIAALGGTTEIVS